MDRDDVRRLRRRLGLSQQHLAFLLGVSWVTVSRWENGGSIAPFGDALLGLLDGALARRAPEEVTAALRRAAPRAIDVVRTLVALESGSDESANHPSRPGEAGAPTADLVAKKTQVHETTRNKSRKR